MSATNQTPKRQQCRHIRTSGQRCGMACLRHEPFCYYHHTTRRPAPNPRIPRYPDANKEPFALPVLEDRAAVQLALYQVLARIANNELDPKRAGLLLYGLQIVSTNLPREPYQPSPAEARQHADTLNEENLYLDRIEQDPSLGALAPIAELLPPEARENYRKGLLDRMIDEIRGKRPHCLLCNPTGKRTTTEPDTTTEQQDATQQETTEQSEEIKQDQILPTIHAVEQQQLTHQLITLYS